MNPLDLRGPEFLLFYLVYGLGGIALASLLRLLWSRGAEAAGERHWNPGYYPRNDEAYGVALLRGGRKEAVRTLLGRLVVTGAVTLEGGEMRKGGAESLPYLSPLERTVLDALPSSATAGEAEKLAEQLIGLRLAELEGDLERQGLVPTEAARRRLRGLRALVLVAIPGLGVTKLLVALSRGKTNVGFLLILLAVYTVAILLVCRPPRQTAAGRRYLEWLQQSHWGLHNLAADGRRDDAGEATLVAAIFGIAALPSLADLRLALQPRHRAAHGGGGGAFGDTGGDVGIGGESGSSDGGGSGCGGGGDSGGGDGGGGGCGGGGCGGCGSG